MRIVCALLLLAACHSEVRRDEAAPPGALLHCESTRKSAYETYGAEKLLALQHTISASVKETRPGDLAAFLVYAFGGPASVVYLDGKTYQGAARPAHKSISSAQYDELVTQVIIPWLLANGVTHGSGGRKDSNDVKTCFQPALLDPAFKAWFVIEQPKS